MFLPKCETKNWPKTFQILITENNINHSIYLLLVFLLNCNSFCTISLLRSVADIPAEHNPGDRRQKKERKCTLLQFAGVQLGTNTGIILMNK